MTLPSFRSQFKGGVFRTRGPTGPTTVFISFEGTDGFHIGCSEYHMHHPGALDRILFYSGDIPTDFETAGTIYSSLVHRDMDAVEAIKFLRTDGGWYIAD
jgi:hypothetical protein